MVEKIKKESSVIRVLARIVAQYPRDEKILITPGFQIGSQILEELTRSGTPWMNFRSMTMYALARQSAELASGEVLTEVGMKTILDTVLTQLVKLCANHGHIGIPDGHICMIKYAFETSPAFLNLPDNTFANLMYNQSTQKDEQ
ncbi:hypothetical protein IIB34_08070 [PVC group bacterium]|nr:hypothetical protein [PVC group bacterium]